MSQFFQSLFKILNFIMCDLDLFSSQDNALYAFEMIRLHIMSEFICIYSFQSIYLF